MSVARRVVLAGAGLVAVLAAGEMQQDTMPDFMSQNKQPFVLC